MVEVEFYCQGDRIKGFVAQGHTETAPRGQDLVCAAISALTQTAIMGLQAYLPEEPNWRRDEEGYLECWLPEQLSVAEQDKAAIIMGTLELGLRSIAATHGKSLRVKRRRWTRCATK